MKTLEIPFFEKKSDLFQFLKDNERQLMTQKKNCYMENGRETSWKWGLGMGFSNIFFDTKANAYKSFKANEPMDMNNLSQLKVKAVINTTNFLDMHGDVHMPGLWKQSLSQNKNIMHLQEHRMSYATILSDGPDLKAYTQKFSWLDLGYTFPGVTEALVFESTIKKNRNEGCEFMIGQYAQGYVKNHSVGMQYVQIVMCINDDSPAYGAEFEAWEKYYPEIVNKEVADDRGYFWAIKEAKAIEGSAVPIGSNTATPTLDNNMKSVEEPEKKAFNVGYVKDNFKLVI